MENKYKAINWSQKGYGQIEFTLPQADSFERSMEALGYSKDLQFGYEESFYIEVWQYWEADKEKQEYRFIAVQGGIDHFDLVLLNSIVQLNEFLNTTIPILKLDWEMNNLKIGHWK